jgi:hypothetical protein
MVAFVRRSHARGFLPEQLPGFAIKTHHQKLVLNPGTSATAWTTSTTGLFAWFRRWSGLKRSCRYSCGEKDFVSPTYRRGEASPGDCRLPSDVFGGAKGNWRIAARHAI